MSFQYLFVINIEKWLFAAFKFGIKNHSTNQPARCVQVWHFNHLTYTTWLNESSLCKNKFNIFCIHFLQKEDSIVNILLLLSFIGKKVWKMLCGKKELPYQKCLFKKVLICLEKSLKFMKKWLTYTFFQAKKSLLQISQFNGVIRYP